MNQKKSDSLNIAAVDPYGAMIGSVSNAVQEVNKLSTEGAQKVAEAKVSQTPAASQSLQMPHQ